MTKHAVFYLQHKSPPGWVETNLGIFDDADEAREASRNWLDGYERTHGSRPPVSVRPIHNPEPVTP